MRWKKTISLVEVHAAGEIGKVITGGVLDIPGETMLDKMNYINEVDDSIRRFSVYEPRGCAQMTVNLLLPPVHPEADAGFIILQPDRAHAMSGSNSMCVTTALLETGLLPMSEPETRVVLDTPAGLVVATARCRDGSCERVTLDMVPCFADQLDVPVELDGIGTIKVDIAFGGVYYVLVEVDQFGLRIERSAARELVSMGTRIKKAAEAQVSVRHPEFPSLNHIAYTMFHSQDENDPEIFRNCTVLQPGRVDRSPCGTGSSARIAVMHARGQIKVGTQIKTRSIIDSEFEVELVGVTHVGERPAVRPRISGRAWIYGFHQLGLDPSDPYPLGYTLSDTWGEDIGVTD